MLNKNIYFNKNKIDIKNNILKKEHWIKEFINTKVGIVPVISEKLNAIDIFGEIMVRLGINRDNYKIPPGLYAIGNPSADSLVLVTANYKLTFDKLRQELKELSFWIIVLDTKGINVWCAAGKGTFSTKELIKRIKLTKIKELINHNTIILPQLGAPGINWLQIQKELDIKIKYGPVYAKDIKKYIENNLKKTDEMRKINFTLMDRLILTPIEFNYTIIPNIIIMVILFILNLVLQKNINIKFLFDYLPFLASSIIGTILFPILLPFLPFRSFALKGAFLGIIFALLLSFFGNKNILFYPINILLYTPLISFLALNFTGSTTFTSLSGVKKEIKIATPIFIISFVFGCFLKILEIFRIIS